MAKECRLTTFDNPYDPFEEFVPWFQYDTEKGYNTCSHLANLVELSEELTPNEVDAATEKAIDTIIEHDFLNMYKKVYRNTTTDQ